MAEGQSDGLAPASDVDIGALRPGARIGRHEVLGVLGQGGFGITYRARDTQLNREVAIKEYLPTSLAYRADGTTVLPRSTKVAEDFSWGRDRFVAEGQTLASLHHAPGIVRVFDFLEINGTAYIVMEMLRGETLEARLKSGGPLEAAAVDRILRPLLDGLEQVHEAGFLHRDIKPANILLDARGSPTLIDFGASRAAMAGRTTALTAVFTPGYAAPEQMSSARQGPWTDIYGLSATLYHAIAGKPPPGAFDRMLDDAYEPLVRVAPQGFAGGLLAGIDAGLAVRASDRPQSIAGWRTLLSMTGLGAGDATQLATPRSVGALPPDMAATVLSRTPTIQPAPTTSAQQSTRSESSPSSPAAPPPATKGRGALYGGVAAALLLAVGGGAWFALKPAGAPAPIAADQARMISQPPATPTEAAASQSAVTQSAAAGNDPASGAQATAADLARSEAERRRLAEDELAKLKAEIETRDREAQKRAAEEAAERRAQGEREQAAADARAKAEDERAKEQAASADRRAAESAETALRLAVPDRQRLQVALTSLGFDTRGTDGAFGPRTREAISSWQKARSQPATGFLTGTQQQALLQEAQPALQRYDEDQKKDEQKREEQRRQDEEEKAKAAAAKPASPAATPGVPAAPASISASGYDGIWSGSATTRNGNMQAISLAVRNGEGSTSWHNGRCHGDVTLTVSIRADGSYTAVLDGWNQQCQKNHGRFNGTVQASQIAFTFGQGGAISIRR